MYHLLRRGRLALACGILALLAVVLVLTSLLQGRDAPAAAEPSGGDGDGRVVVLLDAGHGGVDPGAIGANGVNEKDINLDITLALRDILTLNGYRAVLIRDGDYSVHDEQYKRIRQIKTSDLKNRLKIIEAYPDAPTLSIHQNFFTKSQYHGAQMFYGRLNPESQKLAEALQTAFRESLQPDNERMVKRSTNSVYILHNSRTPTVLVECGFISNSEECAALCDAEYRQKVAFTIFRGISAYREQSGAESAETTE